MAMTTLSWPDYIIFGAFVVVSLGIGFYHSVTGGRQRTTQEFIMANRKLGILPTAMSLFISFKSGILILGSPAETYMFGIMYLVWVSVAYTIAVALAERLMVPWIYPLKLVSVNDYLEQRFESKTVRVFGAILGILSAIAYMGVAMYAPSAALESATGLPIAVSIPLMAVVSITYTCMGGMRAVIWTDVFQFVVFIGGLMAILIKGLIEAGGFHAMVDLANRGGRLQAVNWSFNPTERHTVWNIMIGHTFSYGMLYGVTQASVQRFSATESLVKARVTLLTNLPALIVLNVVVCCIGLAIYAYYEIIQCDPISNKDITNPNQLVSFFVGTVFSNAPGFAGLFLSSIYGGSLSSISSSLSGSAANCWDDILKLKLDGLKENRKALVNKLLVALFGLIATAIAFLASTVRAPMIQVVHSFYNAVSGPIYGIFLLGGLSRHGNWKGALAGGMSSLCISSWLSAGALLHHRRPAGLPSASTDGCSDLMYVANETWVNLETTNDVNDHVTSSFYGNMSAVEFNTNVAPVGIGNFYAISYMWYALFGAVNAYVIGIVISLIFRDREAEARVTNRLLIPFNKFFTWSDAQSKTTDYQIDDKLACETNGNTQQDVEMKSTDCDEFNRQSSAFDSLLTHPT